MTPTQAQRRLLDTIYKALPRVTKDADQVTITQPRRGRTQINKIPTVKNSRDLGQVGEFR